MPILIKDYTVTQQPDKIFISVEIPNISAQKASIYCSSCYIKINYPPYFFELDLAHEINSIESSASVGEGKAVFQLLKTQENIWETINYTLEDRLQRRQEAEKEELILQEKIKREKLTAKREKERELVKRQIEVEQLKRKQVEELKQKELELAKSHILSWSSKMESKLETQNSSSTLDIEEIEDLNDNDIESSDSDVDIEKIRESLRRKKLIPEIPEVRGGLDQTTSNVRLKFTSRGLIPTNTARESEDAKWLCRIKLQKQMAALNGKSIEPQLSSQKAENLLNKGNEFFKLGNYQSAINLFTESLDIEPNHIKALSNRAASYLKLKDQESCVKDCDIAIKLIEQEEWILENEFKQDDGNIMNRRKQKAKLFARRGYAFTLMGELQKGLDDYIFASKNDEDNKSLLIDIESIRVQINGKRN